MPYIDKKERGEIDHDLYNVIASAPYLTAGELNYAITRILLATDPQGYAGFNMLIGVLECVKQELYRRIVVPYENKKIDKNGDVYPIERKPLPLFYVGCGHMVPADNPDLCQKCMPHAYADRVANKRVCGTCHDIPPYCTNCAQP